MDKKPRERQKCLRNEENGGVDQMEAKEKKSKSKMVFTMVGETNSEMPKKCSDSMVLAVFSC